MDDDIFRKIDEHTQKYRVSHWEGTFRDYLPMVLKIPSSRNSLMRASTIWSAPTVLTSMTRGMKAIISSRENSLGSTTRWQKSWSTSKPLP